MLKKISSAKNLINQILNNQKNQVLLRLPLNEETILAQTVFNTYICVPTWNVDVGVGIIRDGFIEPWTTKMVQSILSAGDIYINVGANFGYYTCLGGHLVGNSGKVISVEANPLVFSYLIRSLYWSGVINIVRAFLCAACDKKADKISFTFDPQYIGGGNLFSKSNKKNYGECIWDANNVQEMTDENNEYIVGYGLTSATSVKGNTIDNIMAKHSYKKIKLLHMDVEGAESLVIKGSKETISSSPDIELIIEWDPYSYRDQSRKKSIDEMWNFLIEKERFTVYRISPDNYPGFGHMPTLEKLDTLEKIFNVPHSDLYLKRE